MTDLVADLAKKIHVIRYRLAVIPVEFDYSGLIVVPPSNMRLNYKLGQVVAIGTDAQIGVKVGDVVLYQMNPMFERSVAHDVDGQPVLFMHHGDAIAKMSGRQMALDQFTVLGRWILVTMKDRNKIGEIYLPDNYGPDPEHEVIQVGDLVTSGDDGYDFDSLKVGATIYVDKTKATEIKLSPTGDDPSRRSYFYIDRVNIHGFHL